MLTRNSVSQSQPTPLRRSARLNFSTDSSTQNANSKENTVGSTAKSFKKPIQSSNCVSSTSGLRRPPRYNTESSKLSTDCVNSTSGLRKSPRLNSWSSSNKPEGSKSVESKNVEITEDVGVKRKRKREGKPKDGGDAVLQGWTREQELALQSAYFSAKPTPNFWKKVSKLVPGKSTQECFDRIQNNHLTPPPLAPRSRAKRKNLPPIEQLSFSPSKLLQPPAPRSKTSGRGQHKSYLVQKKTVRHLLRKHHFVGEGDEADLFPILEPGTSPSMHVFPNVMLSTPKDLLEKQGVLRNCHERSSSGRKKDHSKLGNSCTGALVSPPVLKQIKNRALHEKYIDQLHNREAKRKAKSAQAETIVGKENINRGSTRIQVDKVKAAKNTLVSDAREVINQLQHLRTTSVDDCLDLNDDGGNDDDDIKL